MSRSGSLPCLGIILLLNALVMLGFSSNAMTQVPSRAGVPGNSLEVLTRLEDALSRQDIEMRLRTSRGQTTGERLTLDYGASLRFGIAGIDDAFGDTRTLLQYEANVYVAANLDGGNTFFGNLRFLYNDYPQGDSFDGDDSKMLYPIGNRYWYEFDMRAMHLADTGERLPFNINARVGRMFLNWNTGAVFSNDAYAFRLMADWEKLEFVGLIGRTARSGLYDFDISRPNYDGDTDRHLFAFRLDYEIATEFKPFVSYFIQRDHNPDTESLDSIFGPMNFDYNSQYFSFGATGSVGPQLTYSLEIINERGTTLSSPFVQPAISVDQTLDSIDAWAGVLNVIYALRDSNLTNFSFTGAFGTGDSDRLSTSGTYGGNRTGTTDRSFNSLGYIYTGLAYAPDLSNLAMFRLGTSTALPIDSKRPDALRIGGDFFFYNKMDLASPTSGISGDSHWIGFEMDLRLDWRITSDISANVRYGIFFPGNGIDEPFDKERHFIYGGVSYAF
ncbi:MAG: alginate export family protein [Phycisphaerales bacterium]|nr:alginate export family protein [Phycisphaerales bacterium]